MKTRFRRISRKSFSVLLALVMILTTLAVGSVVEIHAYSGWKIKGSLDNWSSDLWSGSGSSGDAYIDCSSLIGQTFEFKLICQGTYCGTSETNAISLGSEKTLTWNGGNNIKYNVTKGVLKINVNDTKITIKEDYARYKVYYNTSKTSTGGTGVDLIPQSGSTNSRVGTASLSTNTKYYFYVKDVKESKYIRNESGTMNNTENEIQLYEYGSNNSNSIDMTTNIAGSYTFTYDSNSKKIKTKYPDYTMNVENDGHGTPSVSSTSVANYNGSTTYSSGTPSTGYLFDYWELTAGSVSPAITNSNKTNTSLTLSPTGNVSPIKLKAHYKLKTYTITYNAGANGSGTVASTTKTHGTAATLSSSTFTRSNYTQTGWSTSDGGSKDYDLGGSYTNNANITLYPFWTINSYNVTFSQPSNGEIKVNDSTTSPQDVSYGSTYTVKVTPDSGYKIKSLTIGGVSETSAVGSTIAYQVTKTMGTSAVTVVAEMEVNNKFNASITTSGLNGSTSTLSPGSITDKNIGDTVSISASIPTGYNFTGWTIADSSLAHFANASSNSTTLTVDGVGLPTTITANFSEKMSGLTVATANSTMGTVSSTANSIGIDTSATITASPNQGYRFVSWTVPSGVTISGQTATATVTATTYNSSGYTVTANFEEIMHTVTVSAGTGGTVSPTSVSAGQYTQSASITATPNTGYAFSSWSVPSGVTISTGSASSATIKVKATADSKTVTASFSELDYPVTIVNNGVTSQVNAHVSTGTTVNSASKTGYSFEKWTVSGGSIKIGNTTYNSGDTITTANITFTTTSTGVTLTNSYKENKYNIDVSAETLNDKALGTVSPSGTLSTGIDTTYSLTATAKSGYEFKEWTKTDGAVLSSTSSNPTTLSATNTGTVTANFSPTVLYLDTSSTLSGGKNWSSDSAKIRVTFSNASSTFYEMTKVDGDSNVWYVDIPSGVTLGTHSVHFYRTNPNNLSQNWNETGDCTVDTKKNEFKITGWGTATIQESPYFPPVSYAVTLTVTAGGTVTYDDTTYNAGTTTNDVMVTEEDKTITATPANGYRFVGWTASTDVHPASSSSASTNIHASGTGTLTATFEKIDYTLTGTNNPAAGGSIKFSSDPAGTHIISTAQIGDTFYVTATPTNQYYTFTGFTITSGGTGTTLTNTTGNIGTYTMGYQDVTIRANYAATTPVWGTNTDSAEVELGNSLTYTPVASYWTSITYTLYDETNTQVWTTTSFASSITIPSSALTSVGEYTLRMTATNTQGGLTSTANYSDVTVTVKYHTESITYYVDMHSSSVTAPEINFTDSSGTILTNESGGHYTTSLIHRSNGIWSRPIQTPISTGQTELYVSVTAKGVTTDPIELDVASLRSSREIWFEAANDFSTVLTTHTKTEAAPTYEVGGVKMKRYYLRKPVGWVNQSDGRGKWVQIGMYYWEGTHNSSSWSGTSNMTWLGNDTDYHYYCMDIPEDAKSIIFQGKDNSNNIKVQTVNLDGTKGNYWELLNEKDGDKYKADVVKDSENAVITAVTPYVTKYIDRIAMNKTLNAGETNPCVMPGANDFAGAVVSFSSDRPSVATVNSTTGVVTPVAKGTATITITIKGTVGALITTANSSANPKDYITRTVSVTVHDPDAFAGCLPMSYTSQTTTVSIPTVDSNQPGYFEGFVTKLSGVANGNVYENAGIVTPTNASVTINNVATNKAIAYQVKYAEPNNDFDGYDEITLTADVTTKSIKQSTETDRYGFARWERSPSNSNITTALTNSAKLTTQVTNSIETTNVTVGLDGAAYTAIFESYRYTDVTFTFQYYEYKPRVNDGKQVFFYEPEYAAESGFSSSPSAAYLASHTLKSYVLEDVEIRAESAATVLSASSTNAAIKAAAESCMHNVINNYYAYSLPDASSVLSKTNTANHAMAVTVLMTGTPRKYKVFLNENEFTTEQTRPYYQGEIELTSANAGAAANTNLKWKSNTGEELAIDTGYKFRVTEDTYIVTEAASATASKDNSSVAKNTGHEIIYEKPKGHEDDPNAENVEKLKQNFYVADFFLPEKVLDPDSDPTGNNDLLPYDDVKFVGGGEFYYTTSSAGKPLSQSIINNGYVDDNGDVVASEIQTAIKDWINDIYYDVHDDDPYFDDEDEANSVMFGTAIPDRVYNAMGFNYYPYEEYSRNSSGALVYDSEKEIYVKTENKDLFRYSNALGAYQYVYGIKDNNSLENEGKKIALYAYYIYSYTDYDDDDNPYTAYSVVVSNKAGAERYVNPTV